MFSTCIKFFNLIFQSISPRPTSIEDMHYKHLFQNSSGISTPKLVQVNSPRKILLKMYQNLIENTCLEIEKLSSVLFCLTARHWSGRCSTAVEGKLDEKNSFSRIRPLMKWASKMKKTEFFIEILRSFEDPKQKAINKQPRIFSGTRRRPSCKSYFLFITFFSRVSQSPILLFFSPKNPFFSSRVENSLSQEAAKKSSEKKTRRTRWRRKSWKNKSTFNSRIRIGEGIHRSSIRSWGDEKPVFISQVFFPPRRCSVHHCAFLLRLPTRWAHLDLFILRSPSHLFVFGDVKQKVNKNCRVLLFGWQEWKLWAGVCVRWWIAHGMEFLWKPTLGSFWDSS